jgi:hypothetical protein
MRKLMPVVKKETIEISLEEYKEIVEAEVKIETIKRIAQTEDIEYGYSKKASEIIDAILGIKRDEK